MFAAECITINHRRNRGSARYVCKLICMSLKTLHATVFS